MFNPNKGLPIGTVGGRPMFYLPKSHLACISSSGGGKTSALVLNCLVHGMRIPNKHGLSKAASCLVFDTKYEIYKSVARCLKNFHGFELISLTPANKFGVPTFRYNPLQIVIDDFKKPEFIKHALSDAIDIAHKIIKEPPDDQKNSFFRNGSRNIFVAVALYYASELSHLCNLPEIFCVISNISSLESTLKKASESTALNGVIALLAKGVLDASEEHFQSFHSGILQELLLWAPCGVLADTVSTSDFSIDELMQTQFALFFMSPFSEMVAFAPDLALKFSTILKGIMRSDNKQPIYLQMDEFTNLPLGKEFANYMTVMRGFDIHAHIILQSISELERIHGKEAAKTILAQCELIQISSCKDYGEAELYSKMAGEQTIKTHNLGTDRTSPWSELKDSIAEASRFIYKPDEILRMDQSKQLIFINGEYPIAGEKLYYNYVDHFYKWIDDNPIEGGKLPYEPRISMKYEGVAA